MIKAYAKTIQGLVPWFTIPLTASVLALYVPILPGVLTKYVEPPVIVNDVDVDATFTLNIPFVPDVTANG